MTKFWKNTIAAIVVIVALIVVSRYMLGCGHTNTPTTEQQSTPQNNDSSKDAAVAAAQKAAADAQAAANAAINAAARCHKCMIAPPRRIIQSTPSSHSTPPIQQSAAAAQAVAPPQPPVAQPTDNRKYPTAEEIQEMVRAEVARATPKNSSMPTPVTVTVAAPVETSKVVPLTMVCAKPLDQKGNCPKWRKATVKDWEKQFPAPTSYTELQLKKQTDAQNGIKHAVYLGDAINAVTAGSTLAGVVKNGSPTAIANANASASSSSSASAVAAEKAGFGVMQ